MGVSNVQRESLTTRTPRSRSCDAAARGKSREGVPQEVWLPIPGMISSLWRTMSDGTS